jgi:hypothetical protein
MSAASMCPSQAAAAAGGGTGGWRQPSRSSPRSLPDQAEEENSIMPFRMMQISMMRD